MTFRNQYFALYMGVGLTRSIDNVSLIGRDVGPYLIAGLRNNI